MHGGLSIGPRTPERLDRSRTCELEARGAFVGEIRAMLAESGRRWRELRALPSGGKPLGQAPGLEAPVRDAIFVTEPCPRYTRHGHSERSETAEAESNDRLMAKPRHLRKAPITEALVDIRIERLAHVTSTTFADLRTILADRYPTVNDQRGVAARIEIRDGKLHTQSDDLGFQGLHFKSADGLTIAQFRSDGFTVNRLKPYQDWTSLWGEASRLWPLYVERAKPGSATRLAVRYINQLQFPLEPGEDFNLYLEAAPEVPADLPQMLSTFLVRVVLHHPEHDLMANVTQALEPIVELPAPTRVLLDIDAFRAAEIPTDLNAITPVFEQLHAFKNAVFFSYLTDRAVGLYE